MCVAGCLQRVYGPTAHQKPLLDWCVCVVSYVAWLRVRRDARLLGCVVLFDVFFLTDAWRAKRRPVLLDVFKRL